jgi:hypothetical protein
MERKKMNVEWKDKTGRIIEAGDIVKNEWNDPHELPVLSNEDGCLCLGDIDTPFDVCYQFDKFWEVVGV